MNDTDQVDAMAYSMRASRFMEERRKAKRDALDIKIAIVGGLLALTALALMFFMEVARAEAVTYEAQPKQEEVMLGVSYDAEVSAYTASEDETDSRPWEMASGKTVYDGALACPARLAFGTRVVIQGSIYICEDRMNGRYRDADHFDILMDSKAEAFEFGRQQLSIIVLQ